MIKKLLKMESNQRFEFMLNNIKYDDVHDIRDAALAKYNRIMRGPVGTTYKERCYCSRLLELVGDCEDFLFH